MCIINYFYKAGRIFWKFYTVLIKLVCDSISTPVVRWNLFLLCKNILNLVQIDAKFKIPLNRKFECCFIGINIVANLMKNLKEP